MDAKKSWKERNFQFESNVFFFERIMDSFVWNFFPEKLSFVKRKFPEKNGNFCFDEQKNLILEIWNWKTFGRKKLIRFYMTWFLLSSSSFDLKTKKIFKTYQVACWIMKMVIRSTNNHHHYLCLFWLSIFIFNIFWFFLKKFFPRKKTLIIWFDRWTLIEWSNRSIRGNSSQKTDGFSTWKQTHKHGENYNDQKIDDTSWTSLILDRKKSKIENWN